MFLIASYDAHAKVTQKLHKIFYKYIPWRQYSVFRGEISQINFLKLKNEVEQLKKRIKDEEKYFFVEFFVIENKNNVTQEMILYNLDKDIKNKDDHEI